MGERMPPVTESAESPPLSPNSPGEGSPPTRAHLPPLRDARGTLLGERHLLDAAGNPVKNRRGNFMIKPEYRESHQKRGDFSGGQNPGPRAAPSFNTSPANDGATQRDPNLRIEDEYDLAADVYLQTAYGPVIIAFSEQARPDAGDHTALKVSLANYLRLKQIKEPSPGWGFLLTLVAVIVKKSAIPEVRERAQELGGKLGITKTAPQPQPERKAA